MVYVAFELPKSSSHLFIVIKEAVDISDCTSSETVKVTNENEEF